MYSGSPPSLDLDGLKQVLDSIDLKSSHVTTTALLNVRLYTANRIATYVKNCDRLTKIIESLKAALEQSESDREYNRRCVAACLHAIADAVDVDRLAIIRDKIREPQRPLTDQQRADLVSEVDRELERRKRTE